MSTVVDYIGRRVDMLAFHGTIVNQEFLADMVLVEEGGSGQITAGIVQLAQRTLLELLTEEGSIPYDPTRGTLFMRELRLGQIRTTIEAEQSFSLAVNQLSVSLVAEEDDDTPDDEKFDTLVLDSLALAGDKLTVRATLTSVAGEGITILLPLTVPIG